MLILGKDKTFPTPSKFLFVDDGKLFDDLDLPPRRKVTVFDFQRHHFNPLKDMDEDKARDLAQVIYASSPQGENTLTVRNGRRALQRLLLKAKSLDKLPPPSNDAEEEAHAAVEDVLFSPKVRNVLTNPTNFPLNGIVLARLDRSLLGDFNAFILANLLMLLYKGHIIVSDYGAYACPWQMSLIRQDRLTAGLNDLDEVDEKLRRAFLRGEVIPSHCTYDDAVTLASNAGLARDTVGFSDYVKTCMGS